MLPDAVAAEVRVPHKGMPPLDMTGPQISFFEFWPQRYFYAPMFLYWLWLTVRHGGFTILLKSFGKIPSSRHAESHAAKCGAESAFCEPD